MRKLPLFLALLVLAACGSEQASAPTEPAPAAQGAAPPTERPPALDIEDGPPPAWIETETGSHWLAYSSYCWGTGCIDYVDISSRQDVPLVRVRKGETVRFHLGFDPSKVSLTLGSTDLGLVYTRGSRA
jgi:hypothetical protein